MKAKSEAKVLETDVVIFPMKFGQNALEETALTKDAEKTAINQTDSDEQDTEDRFMRLRKSLRKRSASIL